MLDSLLLQSKNDIPFIEAQITIHQPSIKEIGLIGEETFLTACNILSFKKEKFLSIQDKNNLRDKSNFEVLMSIINKQELEIQKIRIDIIMFLTLLFPSYKIEIEENKIIFSKDEEKEIKEINNNNYEIFKNILEEMFCLKEIFNKQDNEYNPSGKKAMEIAKKLEERRKKLNKQKAQEDYKTSIFSQYVSILSVGEKKDKNELLNYSIYQLLDEFNRFNLKQDFDMTMKLRLAGAKDVKDVENWMKDIHSSSK